MPSLATFTRDLAKLARYPLEGRTETRPARSRLAEESGSPPLDVDRYAARVRAFDGDRFAVATELAVTYRDRAHRVTSWTRRRFLQPILRDDPRRDLSPRTVTVTRGAPAETGSVGWRPRGRGFFARARKSSRQRWHGEPSCGIRNFAGRYGPRGGDPHRIHRAARATDLFGMFAAPEWIDEPHDAEP